jgi:hypothetical protein
VKYTGNFEVNVSHWNRREIARLRVPTKVDQVEERAIFLLHQRNFHQGMGIGY